MTDDELTNLADRLEAASDRDAAKSRLLQTNAGFLLLQANRDACLRVAAASLQAALWTRPEKEDLSESEPDEAIQRDPNRLLQYRQIEKKRNDYVLGMIERVEFAPGSDSLVDQSPSFGDRVAIIGCATVFLMVLFLIVSGVIFWVQTIG